MSIFQSTLPIQGETGRNMKKACYVVISIHSPYTGRDCMMGLESMRRMDFNPLSLYRERPAAVSGRCETFKFQSTLPIQGETDIIYISGRI